MWIFNDNIIESHDNLHQKCTDIVYCITYESGVKYVGKKTVRSESILPAQKSPRPNSIRINRHILRDASGKIVTSKAGKIAARNTGLKAKSEPYDKVFTNKPFIHYNGSSDLSSNETVATKEILYQCSSKQTASYLEMATITCSNAIFTDAYLNKNISGRYFDNALDGLLLQKEI